MVRVSCMTFNHAPYIEDAMNGFSMQQTNFPFVCTIVDDASTDGEPDVIRKYLYEHFDMEDKSICRNKETEDYVMTFARHKENHNCYFAVYLLKYNHYSIKKSKRPYLSEWMETEYVALCEGDDYWICPEKLQLQVDFLEDNSEYGLVYTKFKAFDEDKKKWREPDLKETKSGYVYEDVLQWNLGVWTLTVCYRSTLGLSLPIVNDDKIFTGDVFKFTHFASCSLFKYIDVETAVYRYLRNSASHISNHRNSMIFHMKCARARLFFLENGPRISPKLYNFLYKKCQIRCISYCLLCDDWEMFKTLRISFLPIISFRAFMYYVTYFISRTRPSFNFVSFVYKIIITFRNNN